MKMSQLILDKWIALQRQRDILHALRDRLHRSQDDANREFVRDYLSNKAFAACDEVHQKRVQRTIESRVRQARMAALAVALHAVEPAVLAFEGELCGVKEASKRPVHPIDAWMEASGGNRQFLKDADELAAENGHEVRLMRFALETASWQPSRWRTEYERARAELSDPATARAAASFILFAESKHVAGWSGPTPANIDEEQHAVGLRKLIAATQAARIPPEVAEIEGGLEDVRKLAGRVRSLDKISPINPAHDPQALEAFETELAAAQAESAAVA